jgi:hypothetical protein
MRELTVSELDAVARGQFTVLGNFTQSNTVSITQTAIATATNSGAITATATGGSATAVGAEAVINIASSAVPTNNISADLNSQISRVSSIWRGLGAWEFPRQCRILQQLKGQTRQCCTRNRQFTKRRLQVALKGFVNDLVPVYSAMGRGRDATNAGCGRFNAWVFPTLSPAPSPGKPPRKQDEARHEQSH